jgi:hypothetical protein
MDVDAPDDPTGIDDDISIAGDIEDADRVSPSILGNRVGPVELVPLKDLLRLRQVILRVLEVGRINVDESHGQLVGPNAVLHPLNQRETFDAGVSGEAPDVENERLAGHFL